MDAGHAAGSAAGAILGVIKGIKLTIVTLGLVSWSAIFDTLILGAAGGLGGWLIVEFVKFLKKWIKNRK